MCITSLKSALCVCCPSSFTSSSSSPSLSYFAVCLFAQQRRKVLMARAASLINTTCPLSTATSRGSCTPPPCVIHWITICLEFRVIPLDFLLEKQKINFPARVEVYVMGLSLLSRLSPLSCDSAHMRHGDTSRATWAHFRSRMCLAAAVATLNSMCASGGWTHLSGGVRSTSRRGELSL